jgi:tripartite-type tricarboxylate transporter receptor subunit TctC
MTQSPVNKRTAAWVAALVFVLGMALSAWADSKPYYQGKRVSIIVPYGTGGGPDIGARLYARHLGRFIPGNPRFIVQNMTGAGGVVGINQLFTVAKPDGLTLGIVESPAVYTQLGNLPGVRFDMARFQYIGALERQDHVVHIRADLPYKTFDELRRAKQPLIAGTRRPGGSDYVSAMALQALRVPIKIITGYIDSAEQGAALVRGEFDILAGTPTHGIGMGWLTPDGQPVPGAGARPIAYMGVDRPRFAYLPNVAKEKPLPEKEAIFKAATMLFSSFSRVLAAPPETPVQVVKLLREAFRSMVRDEVFLQEAKRVGFEPTPGVDNEVQEFMVKWLNDPLMREAVPLLLK